MQLFAAEFLPGLVRKAAIPTQADAIIANPVCYGHMHGTQSPPHTLEEAYGSCKSVPHVQMPIHWGPEHASLCCSCREAAGAPAHGLHHAMDANRDIPTPHGKSSCWTASN